MHPQSSSQASRDSAQQRRAQNTRAREFQAGRERFSMTKRKVSLVADYPEWMGVGGEKDVLFPVMSGVRYSAYSELISYV